MSDYKQIQKWNICFEIRARFIDSFKFGKQISYFILFWLLLNQSLVLVFVCPKGLLISKMISITIDYDKGKTFSSILNLYFYLLWERFWKIIFFFAVFIYAEHIWWILTLNPGNWLKELILAILQLFNFMRKLPLKCFKSNIIQSK